MKITLHQQLAYLISQGALAEPIEKLTTDFPRFVQKRLVSEQKIFHVCWVNHWMVLNQMPDKTLRIRLESKSGSEWTQIA